MVSWPVVLQVLHRLRVFTRRWKWITACYKIPQLLAQLRWWIIFKHVRCIRYVTPPQQVRSSLSNDYAASMCNSDMWQNGNTDTTFGNPNHC